MLRTPSPPSTAAFEVGVSTDHQNARDDEEEGALILAGEEESMNSSTSSTKNKMLVSSSSFSPCLPRSLLLPNVSFCSSPTDAVEEGTLFDHASSLKTTATKKTLRSSHQEPELRAPLRPPPADEQNDDGFFLAPLENHRDNKTGNHGLTGIATSSSDVAGFPLNLRHRLNSSGNRYLLLPRWRSWPQLGSGGCLTEENNNINWANSQGDIMGFQSNDASLDTAPPRTAMEDPLNVPARKPTSLSDPDIATEYVAEPKGKINKTSSHTSKNNIRSCSPHDVALAEIFSKDQLHSLKKRGTRSTSKKELNTTASFTSKRVHAFETSSGEMKEKDLEKKGFMEPPFDTNTETAMLPPVQCAPHDESGSSTPVLPPACVAAGGLPRQDVPLKKSSVSPAAPLKKAEATNISPRTKQDTGQREDRVNSPPDSQIFHR